MSQDYEVPDEITDAVLARFAARNSDWIALRGMELLPAYCAPRGEKAFEFYFTNHVVFCIGSNFEGEEPYFPVEYLERYIESGSPCKEPPAIVESIVRGYVEHCEWYMHRMYGMSFEDPSDPEGDPTISMPQEDLNGILEFAVYTTSIFYTSLLECGLSFDELRILENWGEEE